MKICSKCGVEKPLSEFWLGGYTKKDGTKSLHSWCKECCKTYYDQPEQRKQARVRVTRYSEKNKERIAARMKKEYDSDPEKHREKSRKWRKENPSKLQEYYKKWRANADRFVVALQNSERHARTYGYSACSATVEEVTDAFTGFCEICGVPEAECVGKLRLHHNHENGRFLGWLCAKCNSGLGMFCDSEELLQKAINFQHDRNKKIEI